MSSPRVTWNRVQSTAGSQPRPRHGHRAVSIATHIIVFGGGNEGIVDELHIYDTLKSQWVTPSVKGSIPAGCAAFGFATDGSFVYVFGGMLEYGKYSNDLHELNVKTMTWEKLAVSTAGDADLPVPRLGHSFVVHERSAYLFGGLANDTETEVSANVPRYLNDLYILSLPPVDSPAPRQFSWRAVEAKNRLPPPRESHSAVVYVDSNDVAKMIVYGGMCGYRLGDVWQLDLCTLFWTQIDISGVAPEPRSLHSACVVDERMYVFGGWVVDELKEDGEWKCTNSLACLNIRETKWEAVNMDLHEDSIPKARAGHASVPVGTRVYVWSGRDGYRKAWNNQVCFKDLWYLETAAPERCGKLQLSKATTNTLELSWHPVSTGERYILQIEIKRPENGKNGNDAGSDVAPPDEIWYDVGVFAPSSAVVSTFYADTLTTPIEYRTDESYIPFSAKRESLKAGTAYRFRIAAINSIGIGEFSEAHLFKTATPGYPGAPTNIKINKTEHGGCVLSWDPPKDAIGAAIHEYSVYLATDLSKNGTLSFQRVYSGDKSNCVITVEKLKQARLDTTSKPAVIFRIAAKNEKGYGPATQVRWLQEAAGGARPPPSGQQPSNKLPKLESQ